MENFMKEKGNKMANNNDSKILELKKQIEEKKNKLDKLQRFTPSTNCSIEIDGATRTNIQTLDKDNIIRLMVKLQSYKTAAETLNVSDQYTISGYKPEDWIKDLRQRLDILSRKDEETKLRVMEDKLQALLSSDMKVQLELNEIENMLKN
jgi:hypothetical protein